jgi:hypothetical protein
MTDITMSFATCNKEKDDEMANPFIGTWTKDGSGGKVTVVITEKVWTGKSGSFVYNSGTYTFEGNNAQLTVTGKGMGSSDVGDKGTATVSDGKMTVSDFADTNMNEKYSK